MEPTRGNLAVTVRAQLAATEPEAQADDLRARGYRDIYKPGHALFPFALVAEQFYRARAAAWRDFARRLRDLLAEMGEQP